MCGLKSGWCVLFLSLTVEALQGKTCQNLLLSGGVGQFEPGFQGEGVVRREYFFALFLAKTRHILLSDSANCTVLRAVVSTQYRRVTVVQLKDTCEQRNIEYTIYKSKQELID